MNWVIRHLQAKLRYALLEDSVIYLNGPRRSGKNTLYDSIKENFTYLTLDDPSKLAAVKANPTAFLKAIPPKTIIDNAILAPEVFRPMRDFINALRLKKNGYVASQFLLTGFSHANAVTPLLENLTGCVKVITVYPFSAAEILRNGDINFIYHLFNKAYTPKRLNNLREISDMIKYATFPEVSLAKIKNRVAWYKKYLANIVNNDTKTISNLEDTRIVKKVLKLLISKVGSLLNHKDFETQIKLNLSEFTKYLTLFQHLYLILPIDAWNKHPSIVNHPKIYMYDTSLYLATFGMESIKEYDNKEIIFRNFIATELIKHMECLDIYKLFHFQKDTGEKIDFVIERQTDGAVVGLELKYDTNITEDDFAKLEIFKKVAGKDFVKGVILYLGDNIITSGADFVALPICTLWGGN